jgi:hypothetical protein
MIFLKFYIVACKIVNLIYGLPRKGQVVHSICENSFEFDLQKSIREMQVVKDEQIVHYKFSEDAPVWFRRKHAFKGEFVFHCANVNVYSGNGVTRLNQGSKKYLMESYGYYPNVCQGPFRVPWIKPSISESCVFLIKPVGYYHFLLESLPQLLQAASKYSICPFILNHEYKFVDEILNFLLRRSVIKREPTKIDARVYKVADYVFSTVSEWSGFVHPQDIKVLKEVLQPLGRDGMSGPKRFFVSRSFSSRAFANQAEVESVLQQHGVKTVYLENLTVADQILLFEEAEFIVANHGAGLANLVWCENSPVVIELFSTKHLNDCFARLAVSLGFEYEWMVAEEIGWGKVNISKLLHLLMSRSTAIGECVKK